MIFPRLFVSKYGASIVLTVAGGSFARALCAQTSGDFLETACAPVGRVRKRLGNLGRGDRLRKKQQCGYLTAENLLQLCFERAPQKMQYILSGQRAAKETANFWHASLIVCARRGMEKVHLLFFASCMV